MLGLRTLRSGTVARAPSLSVWTTVGEPAERPPPRIGDGNNNTATMRMAPLQQIRGAVNYRFRLGTLLRS